MGARGASGARGALARPYVPPGSPRAPGLLDRLAAFAQELQVDERTARALETLRRTGRAGAPEDLVLAAFAAGFLAGRGELGRWMDRP